MYGKKTVSAQFVGFIVNSIALSGYNYCSLTEAVVAEIAYLGRRSGVNNAVFYVAVCINKQWTNVCLVTVCVFVPFRMFVYLLYRDIFYRYKHEHQILVKCKAVYDFSVSNQLDSKERVEIVQKISAIACVDLKKVNDNTDQSVTF